MKPTAFLILVSALGACRGPSVAPGPQLGGRDTTSAFAADVASIAALPCEQTWAVCVEQVIADADARDAWNGVNDSVTGVLDELWTDPEWIERELIRRVATPYEIQLAFHLAELHCRQNELHQLRERVDALHSARAARGLTVWLLSEDAMQLSEYGGPRADELVDMLEGSGRACSSAISEGTPTERASSLRAALRDFMLSRQPAAQVGFHARDVAQLLSAGPDDTWDIEVERRWTAMAVELSEGLVSARIQSVELLRQFLADHASVSNIEDFNSLLRGPYDASRLLVLGAISSPTEVTAELFHRAAFAPDDVIGIARQLELIHDAAMRAICLSALESTDVYRASPAIAWEKRDGKDSATPNADLDPWEMERIVTDVAGTAVDVTDLVLLLLRRGIPWVGLVLLAYDSAMEVAHVESAHVASTELLCRTQAILVSKIVTGAASRPSCLGGATVTDEHAGTVPVLDRLGGLLHDSGREFLDSLADEVLP